jgi:hypothetical protein
VGRRSSVPPGRDYRPDLWESQPVYEHTFLTAQPRAQVRFRRAIERRALWLAEDAAREMPNLPLEDASQLVHLYAERGSPKFERAARPSPYLPTPASGSSGIPAWDIRARGVAQRLLQKSSFEMYAVERDEREVCPNAIPGVHEATRGRDERPLRCSASRSARTCSNRWVR